MPDRLAQVDYGGVAFWPEPGHDSKGVLEGPRLPRILDRCQDGSGLLVAASMNVGDDDHE